MVPVSDVTSPHCGSLGKLMIPPLVRRYFSSSREHIVTVAEILNFLRILETNVHYFRPVYHLKIAQMPLQLASKSKKQSVPKMTELYEISSSYLLNKHKSDKTYLYGKEMLTCFTLCPLNHRHFPESCQKIQNVHVLLRAS